MFDTDVLRSNFYAAGVRPSVLISVLFVLVLFIMESVNGSDGSFCKIPKLLEKCWGVRKPVNNSEEFCKSEIKNGHDIPLSGDSFCLVILVTHLALAMENHFLS